MGKLWGGSVAHDKPGPGRPSKAIHTCTDSGLVRLDSCGGGHSPHPSNQLDRLKLQHIPVELRLQTKDQMPKSFTQCTHMTHMCHRHDTGMRRDEEPPK